MRLDGKKKVRHVVEVCKFLISQPFICGYVRGVNGKGKTDFCLKIFEEIAKKEKNMLFLVNIPMLEGKDKPDYIKVIYTDYDLFFNIAFNPDKRKMMLLDEAGLDFTTLDSPMSAENKFFNKLMPMVRKFKTSIIMVYQSTKYKIKGIDEYLNFYLEKNSKKSSHIWIKRGGKQHYDFTCERTTIPFDTFAIGGFDIYLDLQKLYSYLKRLTGEKAMLRLGEILTNPEELSTILKDGKEELFYIEYPHLVPKEKEKPKSKGNKSKGKKTKKYK